MILDAKCLNDSDTILNSYLMISYSQILNLKITEICSLLLNHKFRFSSFWSQFPVILACSPSFCLILYPLTSPNPLAPLTSISLPLFLFSYLSMLKPSSHGLNLLTIFSVLSPLWPFGSSLHMCSGFSVSQTDRTSGKVNTKKYTPSKFTHIHKTCVYKLAGHLILHVYEYVCDPCAVLGLLMFPTQGLFFLWRFCEKNGFVIGRLLV